MQMIKNYKVYEYKHALSQASIEGQIVNGHSDTRDEIVTLKKCLFEIRNAERYLAITRTVKR